MFWGTGSCVLLDSEWPEFCLEVKLEKGTIFFLKKGKGQQQQSTHSLPFFGLQPGRRVSGDEKQRSHGVHVTESWGEERACQYVLRSLILDL